MASYFLAPNITKYLFLSQTLINPSTLLKIIDNSFALIKVLYQMK